VRNQLVEIVDASLLIHDTVADGPVSIKGDEVAHVHAYREPAQAHKLSDDAAQAIVHPEVCAG
jgi:hypothetical protein